MANKELGGKPGFTPKGGVFSKAAADVRDLQRQGLLKTQKDKDRAQRFTERAYRKTMFAQMWGIDVGPPDELPEHAKIFPGATNADGSVKFSKT